MTRFDKRAKLKARGKSKRIPRYALRTWHSLADRKQLGADHAVCIQATTMGDVATARLQRSPAPSSAVGNNALPPSIAIRADRDTHASPAVSRAQEA